MKSATRSFVSLALTAVVVRSAAADWIAGRDLIANEAGDPPQEVVSVNSAVPEWSYGRRAAFDGTAFTPFPSNEHVNETGVLDGIDGFSTPTNGVAVVNTTNAAIAHPLGFSMAAREMFLHPGTIAEAKVVVVRWTAPSAGTYVATASWRDLDAGGGDGGIAGILVNGTARFTGPFANGGSAAAVRTFALAQGDVVDFVLDRNGGFDFDSTEFRARVALPGESSFPQTVVSGSPYRRIADSPFAGVKGASQYFFLEDFEDGALNTPGVTASVPFASSAPGFRDSVDEDDGVVDGSGSAGRDMISAGANSVTYTFDGTALGGLPTYAGIVWTDVGFSGEGLGTGSVVFEAFDRDGNSLGATDPALLGDGLNQGHSAEDRFFGAVHAGGISRIRVTMPYSTDFGLDHLQFGRIANAFVVPGTANIYGAGHTTPPAPGGDGGGTAPTLVPVVAGARVLKFTSVGGFAAVDGTTSTNSDGDGAVFTVSTSATGGISGFGFPKHGPLVGVFLSDAEPADPAPAAMFTTSSSGAFDEIAPQLRQVFFIGNGKNADGALQSFVIPAGATRLFLGLADAPGSAGAPGYYRDNTGGYAVKLNFGAGAPAAAPTPQQIAENSTGGAPNRGTRNPPSVRRYAVMGDPVNLIFGNFLLEEVDLAVDGPLSAPPIVRSYDSAAADDDGILGFGWRLNLDMRVTAADADTVDVRRADGSVTRFERNGEGDFAAAGVSNEVLTETDGGGWTLLDSDRALCTFGADGLLASVADAHGNVTTRTFSKGRWTGIVDPVGRKWRVSLDGSGRLAAVTDPARRTVRYRYGPAGDLTEVSDAAGGTTRYTYDASHRLLTVTDPAGRAVTTNTWDGQGRVATQRDAAGGTWTFEYASGRTTLTNPLGKAVSLAFDAAFRPTVATSQIGATNETFYDERGLVAAVVDENGRLTEFAYDERGNTVAVTDPAGGVTRIEYDEDDRIVGGTDQTGSTTVLERNGAGDITKVTDPTGVSTIFAVDARGLVTGVTDALGHSITVAYDRYGTPAEVTDALGNVTTRVFDAAGLLRSVTDPLGRRTKFAYDKAGRTTKVSSPDGGKDAAVFDRSGKVLRTTDALRRTTAYTYDAAGDLSTVRDPLGGVTTHSWDAMRRLVSTTRPDGKSATRTYDDAGRVATATSPAGRTTTWTYDALGNVLSVTDPNGRTITYEYDAFENVARITDAPGIRTDHDYDAAGRLVATTDPRGGVTTLEYDAAGRVIASTDPLGNRTATTYDAAGRIAGVALPNGQAVGFGYDAADRLVSFGPTGQEAELYLLTYDAAGQRTTMTDATGTTNYAWDRAGRLVRTESPRGIVTAAYDRSGQRIALGQPGLSARFTYDRLGRPASVSRDGRPVVSYSYAGSGALAEESFGNGVTTTRTTDDDLVVTRIVVRDESGSVLRDVAYALDAAGRRVGETSADFSATFTFDTLDRLVAAALTADGTPRTYAYTYDAAGNRLTASTDGVPTVFTYDAANRIATVNGASVTHDAAGRLTSDGSNSYSWDALHRLTAISGANAAEFRWDADGNLVGETAGGVVREYLTDASGSLPMRIAERAGGAATKVLPGLARVGSDGTPEFEHTESLGTVRLVTDALGGAQASRRFGPFGEPIDGAGRTGLGGEPWAAEEALLHLRARFYSPALGRFLSPDPARLAVTTQSGNPYAYVLNDPVNLADPRGADWLSDAGNFLGGVANAFGAGARTVGETVAAGAQSVSSAVGGALSHAFGGQPTAPPAPPARPDLHSGNTAAIVAAGAGAGLSDPQSARIVASGAGSGIISSGAGGQILGKGGASVLGKGSANILGKGGASVLGKGGASVLGKGGASVLGKGGAGVLGKGGAGVLGKGGAGVLGKGGAGILGKGGASILGSDGNALIPSFIGAGRQFTDPAGSVK